MAAEERIRDKYGSYPLSQLLKSLGQGKTVTEALRQGFVVSYEDLEAALASYLAKRFGG